MFYFGAAHCHHFSDQLPEPMTDCTEGYPSKRPLTLRPQIWPSLSLSADYADDCPIIQLRSLSDEKLVQPVLPAVSPGVDDRTTERPQ